MIMIRKATLQDIPRIAEIIVFGKRVAYRTIFNNDVVSFNELQVINIIEEYRNSPGVIDNMIVYDDGIIKGVINQTIVGDSVEICDFYVEPFFKGQGIGRQLIQQVISESKKKGMKKIFLWVLEENLSARRFYEANGFQENGETCLVEETDKIDRYYELLL